MSARAQDLAIRCLGELEVARGGSALTLPPSKKTRALLGYLVVTAREHSRERLCSLFWDVTDDPKGALRWSLSRLRPLVNDDAERLRATRTHAAFEASGADVDVAFAARHAGQLDALDVPTLERLAAAFRGELLEGLDLPEFHDYQAWLVAERDRFRRVRAGVLAALVERLRHEPARALPHARERVRVLGHDEGAHADLVRLLHAAGLREQAREQLELSRRQIADAGGRGELLHRVARTLGDTPPPAPAMQEVRFCRSRDGTRIAYAVVGDGPPLVKTSHWMSHLEFEWHSPIWRHWVRTFAGEYRLIRYDQRGNGLSQREVADLGIERMVEDLEAVVDACGLDRFPLLGVSQGAAYSIAYAVAHPERVSRMVLVGGFSRLLFAGKHQGPEHGEQYARIMEYGWGQNNPAVRQMFTTMFIPGATPEQMSWYNELQARTASPQDAANTIRSLSHVDVRQLLPRVQAPTLVLHARGDSVIGHRQGLELASQIPGARLVTLESKNHILLEDEPAWAHLVEEVRRFLREDR
jgi:pimeloyl-ACP methyl ester carboxylesterase/DNA-binding SARP family transcriptional activator